MYLEFTEYFLPTGSEPVSTCNTVVSTVEVRGAGGREGVRDSDHGGPRWQALEWLPPSDWLFWNPFWNSNFQCRALSDFCLAVCLFVVVCFLIFFSS